MGVVDDALGKDLAAHAAGGQGADEILSGQDLGEFEKGLPFGAKDVEELLMGESRKEDIETGGVAQDDNGLAFTEGVGIGLAGERLEVFGGAVSPEEGKVLGG